MVYSYGMAKMNRRTTFALDEKTMLSLKKLAQFWHVSQAEVVRKAVEKAERDMEQLKQEKLKQLYRYHEKRGMKSETAEAYLNEVAENRSEWGRERMGKRTE
jgi:hypothetical protein